MPPLTRWFIRTSFIYLILGLITGVWLAAQSVWSFNTPAADLSPVYFHSLAEGWITMLIIGVAFWMFPKFTLERPHGSERLGWASYLLLNIGLLLRMVSEPLNGIAGPSLSIWGILLTLAALLQWLGGLAFIINSWARVKAK